MHSRNSLGDHTLSFCINGETSVGILQQPLYRFAQFFSIYTLVEGKSNRKYIDETKVAQAVQDAGYDPYAAPEILGITAMTKLLG